jgi:voltage-gated potassium channel
MNKRNLLEGLIGLLALISIILVAVETLRDLPMNLVIGIYVADLIICLFFMWEFIHRIRHSENKLVYFKTHCYEILAMVPAFIFYAIGSIPVISAGFRSLRLIRVAQILLMLARYARWFHYTNRFILRSGLLWLAIVSISVVFIGGFIVFILESGKTGAQINNFSDAIWWCISTITTVGYGDIVPNTLLGRFIGMILMIIGIGVMGTFISQVSATLVESRVKASTRTEDMKTALVSEIKHQIDNIDRLTDTEMALLVNLINDLRNAKSE